MEQRVDPKFRAAYDDYSFESCLGQYCGVTMKKCYDDPEKHKFLIAQGWRCEMHPFGTGEVAFYAPPGAHNWQSVEPAYLQAKFAKEKADRKEQIDKYEAEVFCNVCGGNCAKHDDGHHVGYYGLIDAVVSGGFYSENDVIRDGGIYRFSICEDCLAKLFKSFKIPPTENRYF